LWYGRSCYKYKFTIYKCLISSYYYSCFLEDTLHLPVDILYLPEEKVNCPHYESNPWPLFFWDYYFVKM